MLGYSQYFVNIESCAYRIISTKINAKFNFKELNFKNFLVSMVELPPSRQFGQGQVNQQTVQPESGHPVYSSAETTAQLESNHPADSSARVKSASRQFRQSQVIQQTVQLTQTVRLKSNHNSARVKSPRRQFGQSPVSHQAVQLETIHPVQLQPVKAKMLVKINYKKM